MLLYVCGLSLPLTLRMLRVHLSWNLLALPSRPRQPITSSLLLSYRCCCLCVCFVVVSFVFASAPIMTRLLGCSRRRASCLHKCVCVYIYIYIHTHTYTHTHTYVRTRGSGRPGQAGQAYLGGASTYIIIIIIQCHYYYYYTLSL